MRHKEKVTERSFANQKALGYFLSLPERGLRSTGAMAGGLVREISAVVLPASFRRTKLYQSLVDTTLRFVVEQVGRVEKSEALQPGLPPDFVLRRTAGNGIEIMGLLLFRLSPVWVLAALSDLSNTGRVLTREIAETLKENGLLEKDREFETLDQILDGLERTTALLADNVNTPPLDIQTLRAEWQTLKKETRKLPAGKLPPLDRLQAAWGDLKREAASQQCSVFEISSLLALSAATRLPSRALWLTQCVSLAASRTSSLLAGTILDHYTITIKEIHQTGFLPYLAREFAPYLKAAATHFSPAQSTYTEKFLHWCLGRINSAQFRKKTSNIAENG